MSGLIGRKIGMTSFFDEEGKNVPCTVLQVGPCAVTQIKNTDKDGYSALQLAYGEKKEKNTTKPLAGHFKKSGVSPKAKLVEFKEFEEDFVSDKKVGDEIGLEDVFAEGDYVEVIGTSKGKGFQGVVKRHGFGGVGQSTHGQHNRLRAPGSIGASSFPSRVFKGLRMAGQTGGERVTVFNLQILKLVPEKNLMLVTGSVPGAKNSYVVIEK